MYCMLCNRPAPPIATSNGHHPSQDLGNFSTADLVALFKQLHESAQRNWQARGRNHRRAALEAGGFGP
jgi:hypothetical protein